MNSTEMETELQLKVGLTFLDMQDKTEVELKRIGLRDTTTCSGIDSLSRYIAAFAGAHDVPFDDMRNALISHMLMLSKKDNVEDSNIISYYLKYITTTCNNGKQAMRDLAAEYLALIK